MTSPVVRLLENIEQVTQDQYCKKAVDKVESLNEKYMYIFHSQVRIDGMTDSHYSHSARQGFCAQKYF